MSFSIIENSLKLFENPTGHGNSKKNNTQQFKGEVANPHFSDPRHSIKPLELKEVKGRKKARRQKNLDILKKVLKEDKTAENLALLDKLSLKRTLNSASAYQIASYQLKKQKKLVDRPSEEKNQGTVFTEEDFRKFEEEYFV